MLENYFSKKNFEIVYYVNSAEYSDYMDVNHAVNLQIFERFAKDKVDFAIISGNLSLPSDIIKIPCFQWHRLIIFPLNHPLGDLKEITLQDIAKYPLITYNMNSKQNSTLMNAAKNENIALNIPIFS